MIPDFTSDGILDRINHGVGLWLGDSSFGDPIRSDLQVHDFAVADFNGDGRLDVVGAYAGWGQDDSYGGVQLGRGDHGHWFGEY